MNSTSPKNFIDFFLHVERIFYYKLLMPILSRFSFIDYLHILSNSISLWTNLIIFHLTDNYNRFICEIHSILDTHFGDLI